MAATFGQISGAHPLFFIATWVAEGARTVGDCCEIGPAHIAELARCLKPAADTVRPAAHG
ncbi:homocysteine S-methyltransferase family protein [Rhodovulum sp. ES.010]|uniref:homocysteine S-methyltransferase family protein n=1 Tax=Rhodovulum sp. ES.010 TaxID=1882821 RepID=UPI0011150A0D|nr:homocysteine S-methyltransferase family protein [Rhodovulum sp. ES.010]